MSLSLMKRSPLWLDPFETIHTLLSDPYWDRPATSLKSKVDNNENDYTFTVEVPGFNEDEISIEVREGLLEIAAEHKEDSKGKYFHSTVHRSWSLPRGVNEDSISAELQNGILSVVVPKKEIEGKRVEIKSLNPKPK